MVVMRRAFSISVTLVAGSKYLMQSSRTAVESRCSEELHRHWRPSPSCMLGTNKEAMLKIRLALHVSPARWSRPSK